MTKTLENSFGNSHDSYGVNRPSVTIQDVSGLSRSTEPFKMMWANLKKGFKRGTCALVASSMIALGSGCPTPVQPVTPEGTLTASSYSVKRGETVDINYSAVNKSGDAINMNYLEIVIVMIYLVREKVLAYKIIMVQCHLKRP